ncbi:hypothetical protein HDU76_003021 [Blyttiomyces sp. JEL0837]|nr:hypothetical protein HDU76_003021 [Blyttiomyces sp. JEL0837]
MSRAGDSKRPSLADVLASRVLPPPSSSKPHPIHTSHYQPPPSSNTNTNSSATDNQALRDFLDGIGEADVPSDKPGGETSLHQEELMDGIPEEFRNYLASPVDVDEMASHSRKQFQSPTTTSPTSGTSQSPPPPHTAGGKLPPINIAPMDIPGGNGGGGSRISAVSMSKSGVGVGDEASSGNSNAASKRLGPGNSSVGPTTPGNISLIHQANSARSLKENISGNSTSAAVGHPASPHPPPLRQQQSSTIMSSSEGDDEDDDDIPCDDLDGVGNGDEHLDGGNVGTGGGNGGVGGVGIGGKSTMGLPIGQRFDEAYFYSLFYTDLESRWTAVARFLQTTVPSSITLALMGLPIVIAIWQINYFVIPSNFSFALYGDLVAWAGYDLVLVSTLLCCSLIHSATAHSKLFTMRLPIYFMGFSFGSKNGNGGGPGGATGNNAVNGNSVSTGGGGNSGGQQQANRRRMTTYAGGSSTGSSARRKTETWSRISSRPSQLNNAVTSHMKLNTESMMIMEEGTASNGGDSNSRTGGVGGTGGAGGIGGAISASAWPLGGGGMKLLSASEAFHVVVRLAGMSVILLGLEWLAYLCLTLLAGANIRLLLAVQPFVQFVTLTGLVYFTVESVPVDRNSSEKFRAAVWTALVNVLFLQVLRYLFSLIFYASILDPIPISGGFIICVILPAMFDIFSFMTPDIPSLRAAWLRLTNPLPHLLPALWSSTDTAMKAAKTAAAAAEAVSAVGIGIASDRGDIGNSNFNNSRDGTNRPASISPSYKRHHKEVWDFDESDHPMHILASLSLHGTIAFTLGGRIFLLGLPDSQSFIVICAVTLLSRALVAGVCIRKIAIHQMGRSGNGAAASMRLGRVNPLRSFEEMVAAKYAQQQYILQLQQQQQEKNQEKQRMQMMMRGGLGLGMVAGFFQQQHQLLMQQTQMQQIQPQGSPYQPMGMGTTQNPQQMLSPGTMSPGRLSLVSAGGIVPSAAAGGATTRTAPSASEHRVSVTTGHASQTIPSPPASYFKHRPLAHTLSNASAPNGPVLPGVGGGAGNGGWGLGTGVPTSVPLSSRGGRKNGILFTSMTSTASWWWAAQNPPVQARTRLRQFAVSHLSSAVASQAMTPLAIVIVLLYTTQSLHPFWWIDSNGNGTPSSNYPKIDPMTVIARGIVFFVLDSAVGALVVLFATSPAGVVYGTCQNSFSSDGSPFSGFLEWFSGRDNRVGWSGHGIYPTMMMSMGIRMWDPRDFIATPMDLFRSMGVVCFILGCYVAGVGGVS